MGDFLSHIAPIEVNIPRTALICGRFTLDHYTQWQFAALQITCPDSLASAVDKRKAEFLAGRAMANAALHALDRPPATVPIGANRAPNWPQGITGSISHARGHCAAIVSTSPDVHLGVDIEALATAGALKAIRKTALTTPERALLEGYPDAFATLIFSAKETIFKALHPIVQSYFGFDAARLLTPPKDGSAHFTLTRGLHDTLREGTLLNVQYRLRDDHVVTWLCV
jgi:enterobactin synthetase component D